MAIINNLYKDNIVYGIDPHDRSRRLIIAGNETTGSRQKHGIILSRQVNDSWIFNNHSHDNAGSGIMIDRNSRNNLIANNISERNGGDGLVFFESPQNRTWKNRIFRNAKSGIRIRNSQSIQLQQDVITNNGAHGIDAYASSLEKQEHRDKVRDLYLKKTSFSVHNVELSGNIKGQFNLSDVESISLSKIRIFRTSRYFNGELKPQSEALYRLLSNPDRALLIRQ